MKQNAACPSCGAKLTADSNRCDLCGTSLNEPIDSGEMLEEEVSPEELEVAEPVVTARTSSIEPVTCGTCGHVNPAQSRFCNQCGSFLSGDTPSSSASKSPVEKPQQAPENQAVDADSGPARPPSDVGRRALGMIGLGILVVIVLYALTVISSRDRAPAVAPGGEALPAASSGPGELPDSLQILASALEAEGTAPSWAQLGHLYFTAAMQSPSEAARAELASRAVDAFDLSLGIEDDADTRTSLAEAAQFDPRNPMRAVLELQAVLATSPDHIAANYLLGALRARIGRLDGAAESFQRVIDLTAPDDPIHQRAAEELATVRQTLASAPSGQ